MFLRSRNNFRRSAKLLLEQLEDRCVPANFVPVLTALDAALTGPSGGMVQLSGKFIDTDAGDPHGVIIDWHDNTPTQQFALTVGARTFQATHLYASRQAATTDIPSIGVIVTDQAFADQVVAETGTFDNSDFRDPNAVLGQPTRFTSPTSPYGGGVTPFKAPFGGNEILSLNSGESITVKFPVQVFDNPASEHNGADFLVFGNAFYVYDFNTGKAAGGIFSKPGQIEVSQDGVTWFPITNAFADTAYPTNAYQNPTGPFDLPPANPVLSDFGLPVDVQNFDPTGLTTAQIVAAYNGSGGGTPVDIASTGLPWIQYVRVDGATNGVNVDAFSVVDPLPQPVTVGSFNLAKTDQTLGLYVDTTGFFQGTAGADVKWLRGVANAHGNTWYFINQNGDFQAWTGKLDSHGKMVARGTLVAHFDAEVFVHPELLYQASEATLASADAAVAQTLDQTLGLFVPASGFSHGSIGTNVKWLRGQINEFGNTWYFIKPNGDFVAWNGQQSASGKELHHFDPQLFLDPQLLYDASQATLGADDATAAQQLDATLGLFVDVQGFFPNVQSAAARWLRGQPNSFGNPWYFIRDNGDFVAWNGDKDSHGMKIAHGTTLHSFAAQLYLDPQLLYQAAQPSLPAGQVVEARQLQATLGLFVDALGFFPTVENANAKWLRGQPNQFGNTWYFVRANGEFVAWNGHKNATGKKTATGAVLFQFDASVFLNPDPLL